MSEPFQAASDEPTKEDPGDIELRLDSNADQSASQESSKIMDATHVTIQLSQGLHSNPISQQRVEDLIAHLSQSGQLKDDRKITIEVHIRF